VDFFALLSLAREPDLDPAIVEAAFDRCLRNCPAQQAELLAARDCLLDPLQRLTHLLELIGGSTKTSSPPQAWPGGNLGWEIQQTLATTQRLLDQGTPQSALQRALWLNQLNPLRQQLQKHLAELGSLQDKTHRRFEDWPKLSAEARANLLSETIPILKYTHRWKSQLEEALFAIRLQAET
jgi:hypothetical protein